MNNEETIIIQPQNSGSANQKAANTATEQTTVNSVADAKDMKDKSSSKRTAATAAAGIFGGIVGGVGTAAAATMQNPEEPEVEVAEEAQAIEAETSTHATTHASTAHAAQAHDSKENEESVTYDEEGNPDYTNQTGDPVVQETQPTQEPQQTQEPQPTPTSNGGGNDSNEVQVLGVYENGEGQEMAILTDGETVAAVLDSTGNGEADSIWVDGSDGSRPDGVVQEGEVHDISDQHISMNQYEEAYIAQQQEQMQQEHETFAYNADDQQDYNNDAPDLSFA